MQPRSTCPEGTLLITGENSSRFRDIVNAGYDKQVASNLEKASASQSLCLPLPCKWFFPDNASEPAMFNDNNHFVAKTGKCNCDVESGWVPTLNLGACVPALKTDKQARARIKHSALSLFYNRTPQTMHRFAGSGAQLSQHIDDALRANDDRVRGSVVGVENMVIGELGTESFSNAVAVDTTKVLEIATSREEIGRFHHFRADDVRKNKPCSTATVDDFVCASKSDSNGVLSNFVINPVIALKYKCVGLEWRRLQAQVDNIGGSFPDGNVLVDVFKLKSMLVSASASNANLENLL